MTTTRNAVMTRRNTLMFYCMLHVMDSGGNAENEGKRNIIADRQTGAEANRG